MRLHLTAMTFAFVTTNALAAEPVVELGADEEVTMALSAAPEHLRAGAGVYRLGRRGFEEVRNSANGFNCLVSREVSAGLGPVCYDREGSETVMKADIMRGALLRQGRTHSEIDAAIDEAFKRKQILTPRRAGVAYMLSAHFTEAAPAGDKRHCVYPPHVMFYAPYLTNADIGTLPSQMGRRTLPWVLHEGKPGAHILILSPDPNKAQCPH